MENKFNELKKVFTEVIDLANVSALLGWDQQTYMPSGGAEDRGDQLATLAQITHQKLTSPVIGKLLDELKPYAAQLDPDSDTARTIKVIRRQYDKATRVPEEKVAEFTKVTADAFPIWAKARQDNNFNLFAPSLEKIFELRREYASYFAPYDHVYDPQLDDFEPGLKTAEVQQIFREILPLQVELIRAIKSKPQVDDTFMHIAYPEKKQWDFGVEVITRVGYDWERGRQDKAVHPFTIGFGDGDVRITTRVIPDHMSSALFGTLHECGHALYDMGNDPAYRRTALHGAASFAVHESQSRMWENLVGRSLPFWKFFYPRLQKTFPSQLGNVDLMTFYKGINKVEPSLIRVEADEATYNLHIMLRLELEIALIDGSLAVKDLPDAWNQKMKDYLGLTPPDNAKGVLQDIHWSNGYIGYFPTYALGNLISVQLWEKVNTDIPDLVNQIEKGEFKALLDWLRCNIHKYGSKYEPQELVQRVTGSKIDPKPYLRYLQTKYSKIYSL
jgi:carboxypeptidase Taq